MLEYSLSTTSIDLSKVDKLRTFFRGVHAILGFYALGWENKMTLGEVLVEGSEDLYRFFSTYFIEDGETIWDAFKNGALKIKNENVKVDLSEFSSHRTEFVRGMLKEIMPEEYANQFMLFSIDTDRSFSVSQG